ncbi:MAG: ECF-type sigma factor [Planctomycetales bacterium]
MSEVTRILQQLDRGEAVAAQTLLPLVYDELRRLAAARLRNEQPGHSLQATALVHEAYLRLVGAQSGQSWENRGHFFAAAAEAMRRILVESARRKQRIKHGGGLVRVFGELADPQTSEPLEDLIGLDEALGKLEKIDPPKAALVKLRFFAGLTMPEAAQSLSISLATAERYWTYARTWLYAELRDAVGSEDRSEKQTSD